LALALQFSFPIELILASAVLLWLPAFAVRCFCLPASGRRTAAPAGSTAMHPATSPEEMQPS